ncbi:MAG: c-type cytochrome biogenesis protein CcmI [Alphaproteobacteria bacterium]|nr:c-type cytochrome biogenesis protein CcmI [Alphaproteobacteria bacterium]
MLLWIVLVVLALVSAGLIARPFLVRAVPLGVSGASSIYRDQLAELQRGAAAGEIGAAEAEEGRREIARRLLSADAAERAAVPAGFRHEAWLGLGLGVLMPLAALALYAWLGRPDLPAQPLASRDMNAAMAQASLDEIAETLFQKLAMEPNKPDGWVLLGRTYMRLEQFDQAAMAFGQAIAWLGPAAKAEHYSAYGEALTLAAGGRVTQDAKAAFEKALALDPKDAPARYYLAQAKAQAGDTAGAKADLEALLADTPADAPQRPMIEQTIAGLEGAAIKDNPAIRGMVDGLAAKLAADPHNLEGWLMLMTSYVRLGETDKAKAALEEARAAFQDDAAALAQLAAKAKELGLEA